MPSNEIEQLILDALYYRRVKPDTDLQTNLAAQELERMSVEVLPQIEHVLTTLVVPDLANADDSFLGLSGLLGAYMTIGSKRNGRRVYDFLRILPPELQAKAVALIPVFFRKHKHPPQEKKGNDLKPPVDEALLLFIRGSSQSQDKTLRENALWAATFF